MQKPTKEVTYYPNGQIRREEYYLNDKLHRTDGPTFISYYENSQIGHEAYFLNDKKATEEQIQEIKFNKRFTKELEEELNS